MALGHQYEYVSLNYNMVKGLQDWQGPVRVRALCLPWGFSGTPCPPVRLSVWLCRCSCLHEASLCVMFASNLVFSSKTDILRTVCKVRVHRI